MSTSTPPAPSPSPDAATAESPPGTASGARFVSAQQVARHAGVSRSAVSRAFTPGASIAPGTREKVMQAAEALGYQVNDLARGLLANRSRLVGLVVTGPEVGFRAHLAAELTKALIARASVPLMINTGRSDAEMEAAKRTLFGYRAEATIVLSGSPPASFIDLARRNGQPLIVIGRCEPGADSVEIDNAGAARQTAHDFAARGYRRVAFAGSRSGTPSIVERRQAFLAACRDRGLSVVSALGDDSDYRGGLQAARDILAHAERPEAVFCVNDLVALGVMDHARHAAGLSVPRDLAVVGFDDLPEAEWLSYRLTTFRQDPATMAGAAVALLDQRQAEPDQPPARVRIRPQAVIRDSFVPASSPTREA